MSIEIEGKTIETTATGYLSSQDDWSRELAVAMADEDGIVLSEKHWDLINFLRSEFAESSGKLPNTRSIVKAMGAKWGEKLSQRDLYDLFPGDPSKQGGRIAGLPESRRKGGY